MSFKQWIDFKQWSGDPPDEKFTIGNPCSWGTKKKNNNGGGLIIVWIFLQLRGRIFEPLGTDLMAHFVHFSQGSVGIFLLCAFWCCRSLWTSGWNTNSSSGCPRMNKCTSKPWGCACSQVGMGGKNPKWEGKPPGEHQGGVRTGEPGGVSMPGVLRNSLSCLQGKGLPHLAVPMDSSCILLFMS